VLVYNFIVITIVVFTSEMKIKKYYTYDRPVPLLCDSIECTI